jgi:hypothetical protein
MSVGFEILCPTCRSAVPADAPGCPNCKPETVERAVPEAPPEVASMRLKEYHHFVRANYLTVEGPRFVGPEPGGFRLRAYLPFVILLLGLLVGAVVAIGRL